MKASIRRHGIVIRTLEITGASAKIGSGENCEIRVEDPYLAAHVADVVHRPDGWHIVDAGTSLEGLSRGGGRVEDEKIVGGESYGVGGFEILFGDLGASSGDFAGRATAVGAAVPEANMAVPKTMVEPFPQSGGGRETPKTIMDVPLPPHSSPQPAGPSSPSSPQFTPMKTVHNMAVPAAAPAPAAQPYAAPAAPKKKRGLIVVGAIGAVLVLLLIVLLATSGGEQPAPQQAQTTTTQEPVVEPTPPPADPVAVGDQAAAKLELEQALSSWEAAIQSAPDANLQRKYAQTAYEVALVYAAANETARARQYLENVTKFGPPDSEEVRLAKARLSNL